MFWIFKGSQPYFLWNILACLRRIGNIEHLNTTLEEDKFIYPDGSFDYITKFWQVILFWVSFWKKCKSSLFCFCFWTWKHELMDTTTWVSIFDDMVQCTPRHELVYLTTWFSAYHDMSWYIRPHELVHMTAYGDMNKWIRQELSNNGMNWLFFFFPYSSTSLTIRKPGVLSSKLGSFRSLLISYLSWCMGIVLFLNNFIDSFSFLKCLGFAQSEKVLGKRT